MEQLGDYNITAASLKALQQKIDDYYEILTKPREARASSKTLTQRLREGCEEMDEWLDERMDNLIEGFRAVDPSFLGRSLGT